MAWTLPDKGEGQNDLQSILFQEYLEVLVAALQRLDYVLSGGEVTAQVTPDMTVAVAAVVVISNGVIREVTAANATITAADATNPRLDLVVITSAGAIAVRAGTAAANPKPPARTANDVVLAVVYVPATDTTISSAQIVDQRAIVQESTFTKKLSANLANLTTTFAKVTNLDFRVPPGTWHFKYVIRHQSLATTTGIKFCVNHTGTVTSFVASSWWAENTTAASSGAQAQAGAAVFGLRAGGSARAISATVAIGQTISVDVAAADMMMIIEGLMVVTVGGNIELYHGSEVAAESTIMANSALILTKVAA